MRGSASPDLGPRALSPACAARRGCAAAGRKYGVFGKTRGGAGLVTLTLGHPPALASSLLKLAAHASLKGVFAIAFTPSVELPSIVLKKHSSQQSVGS